MAQMVAPLVAVVGAAAGTPMAGATTTRPTAASVVRADFWAAFLPAAPSGTAKEGSEVRFIWPIRRERIYSFIALVGANCDLVCKLADDIQVVQARSTRAAAVAATPVVSTDRYLAKDRPI
jgi:hypothetical protein